MRTNPAVLRDEFKKHLTQEEVDHLGVDLAAGSAHYRAYVGPPYNYDINGGLQFQLLLDLGLREYSSLLEIGCGSLRLGRLAITYLLPNRYFGVEPNKEILEAGMVENMGAIFDENPFLKLKKPSFDNNSKFDFDFCDRPIDYIIAQSIASHTGVAETDELIGNISKVMHENSIAMVTYIRCEAEVKNNKKDGWFYPECVTYTDKHMGSVAEKFGLLAYRSSWPLLNRRRDGLVTSQTPLVLTKRPWNPSLAQRMSGITFDPVKKLTNG
jgi:hypothetical protein